MTKISKEFQRILELNLPQGKSAFLWGPRKVGKSFWIKHYLKDYVLIDFLKVDVFADYITRPQLLRERFADCQKLIVIDEVQMVPAILNEVHWLIENKNCSFLLTGSSPRKLRIVHANLLGGRAWRYNMTPLCFPEIDTINNDDFSLENMLYSGLIPAHFAAQDPLPELRSYVADYLKEEIVSWSVTQNIPAFSEFLRIAALTNGEIINYTNVARESGVSAKIVMQYFQILEDTLLGFRLQPWRRASNRRLITTEKFYLFDVGVANYLARQRPSQGTSQFGKSFEHFIMMELIAYQSYNDPELPIYYWRTASGLEVDFILGDMEVAIEVKSGSKVHNSDLNGVKELLKEQPSLKHCYIVSGETAKRIVADKITILPWREFLTLLWQNKIS